MCVGTPCGAPVVGAFVSKDTRRDTCRVWRGDTCNGCFWRTTAEDCARRCLPRLLWTYAVTMISGTMLSYAPLTPEWAGVPAISSCVVPDCRSCVSGESGRRRTPEEFRLCRTRLRDSRNQLAWLELHNPGSFVLPNVPNPENAGWYCHS